MRDGISGGGVLTLVLTWLVAGRGGGKPKVSSSLNCGLLARFQSQRSKQHILSCRLSSCVGDRLPSALAEGGVETRTTAPSRRRVHGGVQKLYAEMCCWDIERPPIFCSLSQFLFFTSLHLSFQRQKFSSLRWVCS